MRLKLEIRGNSIGEIIDGLKEATRRLKYEVVMRTGTNDYEIERVKPFEITEGNLEHPFVMKVTNHKKSVI